eukprot:TRINITY_DN1590_c0_g1_i2.p1 TRINITY_DN1590_c0_g1~~TRINITY_DN1590_c0_g1_i2.p1  ORF type:complete len:513 (+),score=109.64 TRINITY_DN1590_c0_g1_i2:23-1540(+)
MSNNTSAIDWAQKLLGSSDFQHEDALSMCKLLKKIYGDFDFTSAIDEQQQWDAFYTCLKNLGLDLDGATNRSGDVVEKIAIYATTNLNCEIPYDPSIPATEPPKVTETSSDEPPPPPSRSLKRGLSFQLPLKDQPPPVPDSSLKDTSSPRRLERNSKGSLRSLGRELSTDSEGDNASPRRLERNSRGSLRSLGTNGSQRRLRRETSEKKPRRLTRETSGGDSESSGGGDRTSLTRQRSSTTRYGRRNRRGAQAEDEDIHESVVIFQTAIRRKIHREKYRKMVKDSEYRARVAQELWETEKHYVNYLDLFVKSFLYPLREDANRSEKPMLSVENIKNVFSSIEIIVGTNKILLQDINAALENWSINQKLGHIMKYMTKYLRVYTDYITNYDFALRKFSDLRKNNKKLDATVQEIETASCFNGLSFSSLLIMPVQRIPRYNMLLQDILKHTWEFHPDYQDLYDVTQEIGATADYLNSKKAESESIFKVQELEDSITGLKIDVCLSVF